MDVTSKGLATRQAQIKQRLGALAYDRLTLTRRIDEIDKVVAALESMHEANETAQRDVQTDAAIGAAQADKAGAIPTKEQRE
jgi:hypothetical protein